MTIHGWYYLHTNGSLIYKRDYDGAAADIRESDFARMLWPMNPADRAGAWRILVEATALGANADRVRELAEKWKCDDGDAATYADYLGLRLYMDGSAWCATLGDFIDLQSSPAGFGNTPLEAMAALCSELGFKASKMWGRSFADLCGFQEPRP